MASGKLKIDIDVKQALGSVARLETTFAKLDKSLSLLSASFKTFSIALSQSNKNLGQLTRGYTVFGQTLSNVRKEFTANVRITERANNKLAQNRQRMAALIAPTKSAALATSSLGNAQRRTNTTLKNGGEAFANIRRAALAYIAALATGRLIEFADSTQRIDNRIKLALKPGQQFEQLFDRVGKTAIGSRQPLEATATAFFRISQASKSLGISQDAALEATNLFNKLLTVQGVTSHEARSALLQYSQALQSGRFQGDEFRAISEILPQILDFLAEATGRTTAELRDLARQGQITPRVMLQALFENADEIAKQFNRTNVTLTQGFNILMTQAHLSFSSIVKDALVLEAIGNTFKTLNTLLIAFLNTVGMALRALGVVTHFFNEILAVTIIHFRTLIALTLAKTLRNLSVAFGMSARAAVAFNIAIRANPLFIFITTVVLAAVALRKYFVQIKEAIFGQEELNEETSKFNALLSLFGDAVEAAGTEYGKWSMNLQQGAVAIGTMLAQNVLKGIDDISAALGRALVTGESFKDAFLNIMNIVKVAIVEALVQTLVKTVITALFAFIAKLAEDIRDFRRQTVDPEIKLAMENAKQAKSLNEQVKAMERLRELQDEKGVDPFKDNILNVPKKTPEGFNPFGAIGGGSKSGIGTSLTTGALMSAGVPPVLSQSIAAPINKLGKDILGGLNMNKMGIVNKLTGLGNITEGVGLKQISTLTKGFGGLSGLLGGSGIPGVGGIIKKVGKFFGGFAEGGRPPVGLPSIVGEQGPEVFVPDSAGTIVPNNQLGGTIVIQRLEILPNAQIDEALTAKPLSFWTALTQEKILPALNTLGQQGNTTTLQFRENR
tara:strand:- start:134 stop:2653 length:2520 start_codon:yes stop_codon:yes gene_type:complete